jgi:predicted RNase H-like HicB family nuclease
MRVQFVLSDYLDGALDRAVYDKLSDGTFCGRIPNCRGVVAFATTLRTCQRQLRSTLEEWLLLGLKLGHPLPVVRGIDLNKDATHAPMEAG